MLTLVFWIAIATFQDAPRHETLTRFPTLAGCVAYVSALPARIAVTGCHQMTVELEVSSD